MKVSVITVVYNDVSGIVKTVNSVLSQKGIGIQYIVLMADPLMAHQKYSKNLLQKV